MSAGLEGHFAGRIGRFRLDAAFALEPAGLTALTGPSGCGKTTLLRCIAGLARLPGALSLGGEVWQDEELFVPPHRRPVGMVFQDASLLTHLSVKANLLYGLRRAPAPHAIGLDEVVELLGLENLLDRAPDTLSGGERQRAAIGRALLAQPRLLLMDEPLSSLDLEAKAEIMPYIERLHRARAMPILYVSHDPAEVRALADHLLVMEDGAIVAAVADVRAAAEAKTAADRAAAEQALGAMQPDAIGRLALAALLAGLKPA